MSYSSTVHDKIVTLSAGERRDLEIGVADALFFRVFPDGLQAAINENAPVALPEGCLLKAPAGAGHYRNLSVINPTAGALTLRLFYGMGDIAVAGVVTLAGSIPLATGASTAALQTTGNTSLASLAATTVETPLGVNLGSAADVTYAARKSVAVQNTGATGNVTITIGATSFTLAPGSAPVGWSVAKPLAVLADVRVQTAAGGAALVLTTA